MTPARDRWYVAEADGYTVGPMTRQELLDYHAQGAFSDLARGWNAEIAHWRPLARLLGTGGGSASRSSENTTAPPSLVGAAWQQANALGTVAVPKPSPRPSQPAGTPPRQPHAQQSANKGKIQDQRKSAAVTRTPSNDDGQRLLSHANAQAKAKAEAILRPNKPGAGGVTKAAAEESSAKLGIAFRRFSARLIDWLTLGVAGMTVLWGFLLPSLYESETGSAIAQPPLAVILFVAVFTMLILEVVAITFVGTTPGKALMGLSVKQRNGAQPGLLKAWQRSLFVLFRGLGLGVPIFTIFTAGVALVRVLNQGSTSWDDDLGLKTVAEPASSRRMQLAGAAVIGAWILLSTGSLPPLVAEISQKVSAALGR